MVQLWQETDPEQNAVDLVREEDVPDTGWKEVPQGQDENGRIVSLIHEDTAATRCPNGVPNTRWGAMNSRSIPSTDRPGSAFTVSQVAEATFVLSTETAVPNRESALPCWQQRLFIATQRREQPWSAHAQLPPSQTVIIGREVSL